MSLGYIPVDPISSLENSRDAVRFVFKAIEEKMDKITALNHRLALAFGLDLGIPLHRALLQGVILELAASHPEPSIIG
jgi:hypothetical protein